MLLSNHWSRRKKPHKFKMSIFSLDFVFKMSAFSSDFVFKMSSFSLHRCCIEFTINGVFLGGLSTDIDEDEELPLTQVGISFRRDIVGQQQPTNGHHHHHPPGSYHTMTFNHHRHAPQQVSLFSIRTSLYWSRFIGYVYNDIQSSQASSATG